MKKLFRTIIAVMVSALMLPVSASAFASSDQTYEVYNYDRWGEAIPSQAGYVAQRSVTGSELGIDDFVSPCDIFLSDNGLFYIADSGNNRIVVLGHELDRVVSIIDEFTYNGETLSLKNPQSVFVSENTIYIADTENSRIIRCDKDGRTDLVITRPESDLYPENLTFLPRKVIADKSGYIYVTVNNITNGALMYDCTGKFQGFYGANRTEVTGKGVWDYFWKRFTNKEMRKYMTNNVPAGITSFDIDKDSFIYTCNNSLTQNTDAIKKVNAAGNNLFADMELYIGDAPTPNYSDQPKNSYVDIDITDDGLINCLDYTTGRIFQYDEECSLLFITGSTGNQLGTFSQVSALESTAENLYVVDSQKNSITVFNETKFGSIVHEAVRLYNDGYYDEALEPWYEVLKRDGNYRHAYVGISSALINRGEYRTAMKYAKLADAQWLYNRAFEGWREEFINEHFALITGGVVFLVILLIVSGVRRRSKKNKKKGMTVNDGSV